MTRLGLRVRAGSVSEDAVQFNAVLSRCETVSGQFAPRQDAFAPKASRHAPCINLGMMFMICLAAVAWIGMATLFTCALAAAARRPLPLEESEVTTLEHAA
jgi:hypothetical protein